MNKLIARAALSIGILVFYPFAVALAATDVLFLLDASGSMREQLNGERKIDSARAALQVALTEVPASSQVALRMFGHRVDQKDKAGSCKDSELAVPFGSAQTDKLVGAVRSVSPLGYTPIAYSLEQSRGDFSVEREADKVIILLSDGEETCGGDPKATITALINSGFKVKVHTIGFKVNSVAQKQLRDIAEVSGGEYFSAENAKDLGEALSKATRSALVIRKERVIYGETIRGGDSFETAVPLPLGKELRLDHVQKADFYDYFSFDANIGDDLSLVTRTLDAALTVKDNGKTEQVDPKMAVQLLGPDRDQMRSSYVSGTFRRDEQKIQARKTGSHYLLVGSNSTLIPVEGGLFMVERKTYGDLDGDKDAGATYATALPLRPGRYENNVFSSSNELDVYSFEAKKGERFNVVVIPAAGDSDNIDLAVNSDLGDRLAKVHATGGNPAKSGVFSIPEDGKYYVTLSACCFSGEIRRYSLVFKQEEATPEGGQPNTAAAE